MAGVSVLAPLNRLDPKLPAPEANGREVYSAASSGSGGSG